MEDKHDHPDNFEGRPPVGPNQPCIPAPPPSGPPLGHLESAGAIGIRLGELTVKMQNLESAVSVLGKRLDKAVDAISGIHAALHQIMHQLPPEDVIEK